jgi:glutamate racemase
MYPAASRSFAAALPDALLIDPAERLAAAVAQRHPHARTATRLASRAFFTTGDRDAMKRGAESAWGTALTANTIRP